MRSSAFSVRHRGTTYAVEIQRPGGDLDHYFHFIMDLVWPMFHWMHQEDLLNGSAMRFRALDRRALHFAGNFEAMLGHRLDGPSPMAGLLEWLRQPERVGLIGFNSRFREHLKVFPDLQAFRRSRTELRDHIAKRQGVRSERGRRIILIEREKDQVDRGTFRRGILGSERLVKALQEHGHRRNAEFVRLRLDGLPFRDQFQAFHADQVIVIGQHGAGLINGIWTTGVGSSVIELAGADNPAHFSNLFTDLDVPYRRLVCASEGPYLGQQSIEVEPEAMVRELDAALQLWN